LREKPLNSEHSDGQRDCEHARAMRRGAGKCSIAEIRT
jgi:hypothetical protein